MKSNEWTHQTGMMVRAVISTEVTYSDDRSVQADSRYSTMAVATKLTEEYVKLGRRYSFDDNGGGYQGL